VLLLSLLGFWLAVRPPRIAVPLTPRDFDLRVEELGIRSADGITLAGWLVPRPAAPTVVLLHGYPADKRDMLPLAAALAPSFQVVLMDLRYFGASGGAATTLGFRERGDLRRLLDTLAARGVTRIGVFGFSLGGAVGLLAAADDDRIRALAAYAPFSDLRVLGRDVYAHVWLLKYPLVELMILWGRLVFGTDISRPAPIEAARRLTIPVLLIASREDEQIPFAHAQRLRDALAANPAADFEWQAAGRHGQLGPAMERRLVEFFRRHLGLTVT
jgi:pimeloyl-ACP methyl ester carboxylesterase